MHTRKHIERRAAILAIVCLLFNTAGRMLWHYWPGAYDLFDALAWMLVMIFLCTLTYTRWVRIVLVWVSMLVMSNLIDEIFFNPVAFGINEIVFLIVVTLWTISRLLKCRT